MKRPRGAATKRWLGGVLFVCVRPGLWVSRDRRYALCEQMHKQPAHPDHQWLLFRTARYADLTYSLYNIDDPLLASDTFWAVEQISRNFTMVELGVAVATEILNDETIDRVRRAMIGIPLKNARHRAVIADCTGALAGSAACRQSVARVWLKMIAGNEPGLEGWLMKIQESA